MPKLTVVERDGKLVIVSEVEANGGPADHYLGLRHDKQVLPRTTKEEAEAFVAQGGKVYMITHWRHKDEWLPKAYKIKEVPHD